MATGLLGVHHLHLFCVSSECPEPFHFFSLQTRHFYLLRSKPAENTKALELKQARKIEENEPVKSLLSNV